MSDDIIIETRKLTKAYRGVPAIKDIDFDLRAGEIHSLVGENGAGKSTLTKIMAGAVIASSGKMLHHGKEVSFASPLEALQAGIAMVFQETSLVPSMTVAQNLYLGDEKFLNRLRGIYISAQQFLQSLNFTVDSILEENMTFHFMPAIWTDEWGYESSETIRIRSGAAAECLSDVARELTVKR